MLSSAGGFLATSTITLAPKYGPSAITSYAVGSALSAVGVSVLQVFTAYTSAGFELPNIDSTSWSATICFTAATLLLLLTLIFYRVLTEGDSAVRYHDLMDSTYFPASERTRLLESSLEPISQSPLHISASQNHETQFGCNFAIFYAGVVTLVCLFLHLIKLLITHPIPNLGGFSGSHDHDRTDQPFHQSACI
jgi:hypothetical protein